MSSSILTNTGAMVALQSLEATNTSLNTVQNQVSTGLKVNTAKDNAAAWTVATQTRANIASLTQVGQGLGNADSILGLAVNGSTQISSLIAQIRTAVVSTQDPSTDVAATQNQVNQLVDQINATIASSSFDGVNLLDGTNAAGLSFLASTANNYTTTGAASTTIATGATTNLTVGATAAAGAPALNASLTALYNLVDSGGSGGLASITATNLDASLKTVDTATALVNGAAATFGAVQSNIEGQQTFINNLASTLQVGVGNIVDANMTAESAQLSALQVQQQLGTQALTIANQAPQLLLKLFG
jgi:flagellin